MAGRRDQISLSEDELRDFVLAERVANVASFGPRGWPHLMPLWYVPRGPASGSGPPDVWIYTYGRSQKARNLERDPRATVMIETGEQYHELRGVMIEAEAEIHREPEDVLALAEELTLRYAPGLESVEGEGRRVLESQARKRVAIRFDPRRVASWDHRKLGGTY